METKDWIQLAIWASMTLVVIVGAYWKLNNYTDKKADKEDMAKELKDIGLAIQALASEVKNVNEKLDEIKKDLKEYRDEQELQRVEFTKLKTEHDFKTCKKN